MSSNAFANFRPRLWLRSGHLQTVVSAYWPESVPPYSAVQHRVQLSDDDQLVLHDDTPANWVAGDRICLLIHGLGGSYRAGHMPRVARKLNAVGVRTFRMDFRGWGAGVGLARRPNHAGRSPDVAAAVQAISGLCSESPITLIGFSLGGNLTLKLCGEWGGDAPAQVDRALALAPPIDLVSCAENMQQGLSQLYDVAFTRGLWRHVQETRKLIPDFAARCPSQRPRRLYDFDDQFTAPLSGYRGAREYYESASAGPLLSQIKLPTWIVADEHDPLIPISMFHQNSMSASTHFQVTRFGGHLGYLGVPGDDPDGRWLEWRVVDWVTGPGISRKRRPAIERADCST